MLAVRCPCCLNRWEAPEGVARLVCPYCGADDVVPTGRTTRFASLSLAS
jgi:hypothetical protein